MFPTRNIKNLNCLRVLLRFFLCKTAHVLLMQTAAKARAYFHFKPCNRQRCPVAACSGLGSWCAQSSRKTLLIFYPCLENKDHLGLLESQAVSSPCAGDSLDWAHCSQLTWGGCLDTGLACLHSTGIFTCCCFADGLTLKTPGKDSVFPSLLKTRALFD